MDLLVRIVDKTSTDPMKDLSLTKRGDVIAYHPPGSDWGVEELVYPEWVLVSVPDMTVAQAESFLQPETPPADAPDQPVATRAYGIDLDALGIAPLGASKSDPPIPVLPARDATYDADQNVIPDTSSTASAVMAAQIAKPPTQPPNVLGPRTRTIGPR